jgi:hypothetical protein
MKLERLHGWLVLEDEDNAAGLASCSKRRFIIDRTITTQPAKELIEGGRGAATVRLACMAQGKPGGKA